MRSESNIEAMAVLTTVAWYPFRYLALQRHGQVDPRSQAASQKLTHILYIDVYIYIIYIIRVYNLDLDMTYSHIFDTLCVYIHIYMCVCV